MWLGCSITAAVCFSAMLSWRRVIVGATVTAWHIGFMAFCWQAPMPRYILLLGTFMFLQSVISSALGIPAWRVWQNESMEVRQPYRFSIRAILMLTTVVALLLSALRIYGFTEITMQLLAIPLVVLMAIGSASTMLAVAYQKIRAVCLVVVLMGSSLLYAWMIIAGASTSGTPTTLRQFLGSLSDFSTNTDAVIMLAVQFGVFTFGCCLVFGLGRIDQRDFERRQTAKAMLAPERPV